MLREGKERLINLTANSQCLKNFVYKIISLIKCLLVSLKYQIKNFHEKRKGNFILHAHS